jgi:murE/murF fusion protein
VRSPLVGDFNASNLLVVLGGLRALGVPLADAAAVCGALTPVPGRMQRVAGSDVEVVVDYAHTPDALEKVLQALRPLATARGGRLWCVFGCGGNRDATKRPLMGAIAARGADHVVLTSDNPRGENPRHPGADPGRRDGPRRVDVIEDRREAIHGAVREAAPGDVVLLAGKGHEDHQEVAGVRRPFSDLARRGRAGRTGSRHERLRCPTMLTLAQAQALLPGSVLHGAPDRRLHACTPTRARCVPATCLWRCAASVSTATTSWPRHAPPAPWRRWPNAAWARDLPGLQVPDTLAALQTLAAAWRARHTLPLIAVTGSNGKTTVTQMVAAMLRAWLGDDALATAGNLNNHIGVPMTLLRLRAHHRAAVVELGMNHPGEIALLARLAAPTVALVNNAQREHQEFMASVQAVAQENGQVIQAWAGGTAVFPADDAFAPLWRATGRHAHAC